MNSARAHRSRFVPSDLLRWTLTVILCTFLFTGTVLIVATLVSYSYGAMSNIRTYCGGVQQ